MDDKQIINSVAQISAENLNQIIKSEADLLKNEAKIFLNGVNSVLGLYYHETKMTSGTKNSLTEIYQKMKQTTEFTQECIKYQFNFEQALNRFLEREISLLYVTQDGDFLYADEKTAAEIYQQATASYQARGRGNINKINNDLKKYPSNITSAFKQQYDYRKNLYKPIYDKVTSRWLDNHDPNRTPYFSFWTQQHKKKDTFYWLINKDVKDILKDKWSWSAAINRGHINEAYVHLVWQNKTVETFDPNNEFHIGSYWGYMLNHNILNAQAGIVGGDVIPFLSEYERIAIQFAVKSGSFSTAAMGSYLDVAYQLLYGTIALTKENVKILLDNLSSYSFRLRQYGLQSAEEKLKELIPKNLTI